MESLVLAVVDTYGSLLDRELAINEWAQERLSWGEPLWRFMSTYLEPSYLFNLFIPLCGIYSQELLVHLFSAVTLVSTLNSFEKWIYPDMRPLWWLREQFSKNVVPAKSQVALESHDLSCETSGGLPCAHSMSLTVFVLILVSFLFVHIWQRCVHWRSSIWRCFLYPLTVGIVVCMWLSRLYFATEFLHQCVLGSYFGIRALSAFESNLKYVYSRGRRSSVILVGILGGLAVAVYFIKQQLEIDPHWSVRQAFKWCPEATYMRHEASPIFVLTRDLGNLMGMALASPLSKHGAKESSFWRRCSVLGALELVNYGLRQATPKQNGRFAFLAYEFARNTFHSVTLLKYSTKLY
ncbi:hypothetical protein KR018_004635 [Drosophila ironensis]|nr:hypothetical protein KR018_004635 [Drosophila ironensis]